MEYKKHSDRTIRHLVSAPFIYIMIFPLIVFDIFVELYHRVCFPLYGLPCVKRLNYIRIDRHRLRYLGFWDKLNCAYCGYANGLVHYASVIAGMTEAYWCGIKHKKYKSFIPPRHHKGFLKYGDGASYRKKYDCRKE